MERILIFVLLLGSYSNLFSQNINMEFFKGEWKGIDGNNEFQIFLKDTIYTIPVFFGGTTESALIGAYVYKSNGNVVIDNMSELNNSHNDLIDYPIWISKSLSLGVWDYLTTNKKGERKYLSEFSKIEVISENSPKQIRWIINDSREQLVVTIDSDDGEDYFFPAGTSLPTNIILTKVE